MVLNISFKKILFDMLRFFKRLGFNYLKKSKTFCSISMKLKIKVKEGF